MVVGCILMALHNVVRRDGIAEGMGGGALCMAQHSQQSILSFGEPVKRATETD